jgi:flagellar protein FlaG
MEDIGVNTGTVQAIVAAVTPAASAPKPAAKASGDSKSQARTEAPARPVVQAAPPAPETTRGVAETMAAVAKQIESYLQSSGRQLQFSVDSSSGRMVIAVRDSAGTLIRQIPGEEALRLAAQSHAALLDAIA